MSDTDDIVIEATNLHVTESETEAHAYKSGRDVPETEAHAARSGRDVPETEAHASLRIRFPAGAAEQTLTVVYRPPARPGDEPEVVLHKAYARSDRRLKRGVVPI